jgi:predicted nuclease of predicted toxin-antitoxin system
MLKLLADENFDNTILRGLLRRQPDIDIIRVQDTELYGANDPTVLAWAAQENRILLTHDVATITRYAYDRIAKEQSRPGVIEVVSGS